MLRRFSLNICFWPAWVDGCPNPCKATPIKFWHVLFLIIIVVNLNNHCLTETMLTLSRICIIYRYIHIFFVDHLTMLFLDLICYNIYTYIYGYMYIYKSGLISKLARASFKNRPRAQSHSKFHRLVQRAQCPVKHGPYENGPRAHIQRGPGPM